MPKIKKKQDKVSYDADYQRYFDAYNEKYGDILAKNPSEKNFQKTLKDFDDRDEIPERLEQYVRKALIKELDIELKLTKKIRQKELGFKEFDLIGFQKHGERQVFVAEDEVIVKGKKYKRYRDKRGRFSSINK